MDAALVDAGFLIALLDRSDRHHEACRRTAGRVRSSLVSVWPVVAEAVHMLRRVSFQAQEKSLELAESGWLGLSELTQADLPRIRELMSKYQELPMDLADAALVRVAERDGIATVLTTDRRDFRLYRPSHVRSFEILP